MFGMTVTERDVICIASGFFECYDRSGPFVATREFDLDAFVDSAVSADTLLTQVPAVDSTLQFCL